MKFTRNKLHQKKPKTNSGSPSENAQKRRMVALVVCVTLLAAAIITRSAMIQIHSDPRLEQMAKRQFQSRILTRPRRGPILDRNGEPLAINVEIHSLAANPGKAQNKAVLARLISKAVDLPYSKVLSRLGEKREFVWLKRHLTQAELLSLKKWHIQDESGDLVSGLWLVRESKRIYPHKELAGQILGGVNVDSEGLEGVELWLNERMRGKIVSVSAIKDALGRPTFIDAVAAKHVQDGEPVQLTLDASLQYAVEEELRNSVLKSRARSGTVVVMNSVSGEILSMASYPVFDPNEKSQTTNQKRNRAITDGYEPGSTLKAALLASALSHGAKLSDQIYAERGKMTIQGHSISEAEAHEKFEWITLKKLIQVSSNVGAAKLALKVGADHYWNSLRAFGLGTKTGVGFPGEISGKVPAKKDWQPLALANIGFGQGVLVTPLQMTRLYASFLNGGWIVQPSLIKDPTNAAKPEAPHRVFSPKVAADVLSALESVTDTGGTGTKAKLNGYRVAGKTGTAQVVDPVSKHYSRSRFVASFIGYAVGVDPKIVIFTALDEPRGVYYASETAAPLFRQVLNAVAGRFSLPTRTLAENDSKPLALPSPVPQELLKTTQAHPFTPPLEALELQGAAPSGELIWTIPPLQGLTPREAFQALQGHKFKIEILGKGLIKTQNPEAGKRVSEDETIRLTLEGS
ncbi:penicillin-binding transpeptidase domain-containing protein [Bdellovibrionota bacterium FG-2]